MNRQANRTARRLFLEAVERYPPSQWPAYLDRCCPDGNVRQAVERLLRAHQRQSSWLDRVDGSGPLRPGTRIGNYQLLELLAESSFGTVYRAEQLEPICRQVALKIIEPGMDTRQVIWRFRAEQQILTRLNHPGIAGVLDAGTTDRGQPYFVMEFVRGQPLTEYCDDHCLSLTERLRLFAMGCDAVGYAHEKGIVHGDLKPQNILVEGIPPTEQIKVIQFGVAPGSRGIPSEILAKSTESQPPGTPRCMSAQQRVGNHAHGDSRSDVYSLGLILNELLNGATQRSVRLRTQELKWIVAKALESEPDRRYETARGLCDDIERYLAGVPVVARPPSLVYLLRKRLNPHRTKWFVRISCLVAAAMFIVAISLLCRDVALHFRK